MSLFDQVLTTIDTYQLFTVGEIVVVGVSGGPDSLCLLHLLHTLGKYHFVIHAAHLNHGIRGSEADADAVYVGNLCAQWGIPCSIECVDVPALAHESHLSLEEAAREARYGFLSRTAQRLGASAVAVGHHADDQAETILMHLLRGAGLAGLRGMRPKSWLGEGKDLITGVDAEDAPVPPLRLVRPLLQVTRAQIDDYCAGNHLQPRLDRTNLDITLYRNRLRYHLLPLLEEYNPKIRQVLVHTADVVEGDMQLLDTVVTQAWDRVVEKVTLQAITLNLRALRALPISLQRSLLRRGVSILRHSLRDLAYLQLESVLNVLNNGVTGKKASLPAGLALTLGYEQAILSTAKVPSASERWPQLTTSHPIPIPLAGGYVNLQDGWQLAVSDSSTTALSTYENNVDPHTAFFAFEAIHEPLSLGTRNRGDFLFPLGMSGHRQKLHDLMINARVPQAERDKVPILRVGKEVAWVVGLRQDQRFAVTDQTLRVLQIQFQSLEEQSCQQYG